MPELRKDPIVDRWVIISPERGERPQDFPVPGKKRNRGICPFCDGNEKSTPAEILAVRPGHSLPDSPGWTLRVVSNKYPALRMEGGLARMADGIYDRLNGIGIHEVIIESPDHATDLDSLPLQNIEDCMKAFQSRILDLKKNSHLHYILIFKNHGEAAGATLEHSHSQLIALPVVPELVSDELAGARRFFEAQNHCIFCAIIAQDKKDGDRVVIENDRFLTLCPYAPRFPFEMWLLPKFHSARFEDMDAGDIAQLARLLKETLLRMRHALDEPPFNLVLHTSPVNGNHGEYYHWHIEIMPKLTKMAGFEQGTGFYINPVFPESAAKTLRNTKIRSS